MIEKAIVKIPLAPISLNGAYFKNRQYNLKAREYRKKFLALLESDSNQKEMAKIRDLFDKNKHYLAVSFTFLQPKEKMFTKKGNISRFSKDLDNCFKLITDFLFNSKYPDKYGVMNFNVDDQFICDIVGKKRVSPSNENLIIVECSLHLLSGMR